ncbi:Derlin-2 [Allomyces javanicus]|nr:Derlin-2 [Allomyces javanicus]
MDRLEANYLEIPPMTRTWVTLSVAVSVLCQAGFLAPFHLYYDPHFILNRGEYWRILSSFFYFGHFGIDLIFHMFFLARYSRLLEEGPYRTRPADYFMLLAFGAVTLLILATVLPAHSLPFLGSPLSQVLVYIWSRRNPFVRMSFLGVMEFTAPYLPWVLVVFSVVMHGTVPIGDLAGIAIGHVYWYFDDIYPRLREVQARSTWRPFKAPRFLEQMFGQALRDLPDVAVVAPPSPPAAADGAAAAAAAEPRAPPVAPGDAGATAVPDAPASEPTAPRSGAGSSPSDALSSIAGSPDTLTASGEAASTATSSGPSAPGLRQRAAPAAAQEPGHEPLLAEDARGAPESAATAAAAARWGPGQRLGE